MNHKTSSFWMISLEQCKKCAAILDKTKAIS